MISIEMLPAAHGDAILVEWDHNGRRHRMLVDSGPYFAYDEIRQRLVEVLGDDRFLDLLVITHIDTDHLDGAIRLLLDKRLGLEIGDVWFNDLSKIQKTFGDELGPTHGEFLGALLDDQGQTWNQAFEGESVALASDGVPRSLKPIAGLGITLLSPGPSQLVRLAKGWKKVLKGINFPSGDRKHALKKLQERDRYAPPEDELGIKPDRSVANGSSIALLLEYGGKKVLLAGDAFPAILEMTTAELGAPIEIDAFKLSHHGSFSSSSRQLLKQLPAERYLISTNGMSSAHHPDKLTLELLLEVRAGVKPHVIFNYHGPSVQPWIDSDKRGEIVVEFRPGSGVVL